MLVHYVRGGKRYVPHHLVTVLDLLRLAAEEEARKHATRRTAVTAFNYIALGVKEPWLAAQGRLVQHFRASNFDPDAPYATEESYFWQLLPMRDLQVLEERALKLCFPQVIDRLPREAQLFTIRAQYRQQLEGMPAVRHELGSPYIVKRGAFTKEIFTRFSNTLAQDAGKYKAATSRQTAKMNALASNKLPLQGRPFSTTWDEETKPSALCMVEDPTIVGDSSHEEPIAALGERSEETAGGNQGGRKRAWDGSETQQTLKRRKDQTESGAQRQQSRTFSPGVTRDNENNGKRTSAGCSRGSFQKTRPSQRTPQRTSSSTSSAPRRVSITPEENLVLIWLVDHFATIVTTRCRLGSFPTRRTSRLK